MIIQDIPPLGQGDLASAEEALRRGDRELAHDICVRLTTEEPTNEQAWLWRAGTAGSPEETVAALSQALMLNPSSSVARRGLYEALHGLLRQDAFVVYLAETEDIYHIGAHANLTLAHPKDRAIPEPFPPSMLPPTRDAFRWLGWAIIGLIPAGLGTLVCAPVAILAAIRLLRSPTSRVDRRRAWLVVWGAAAMWLLAALLVQILILHLF